LGRSGGPAIVLAACALLMVMTVASCGFGYSGDRAAGITDAEASFCTRNGVPSGGPYSVGAAADLAGIPHERMSEETEPDLADPAIAASCELAYELWSLTDEQWNWCYEDENRAELLAPAITAFGMGEEEIAGTESFGEAPGDDPGEYTQACRWSFDRWREDGIGPIVDPTADPFFSVNADEAAWCASELDQDSAEDVRNMLGIEVEPGASEVEMALAETRTCRVAYILSAVSPAD
jgi:hypothetical protein